MLEEKAPLLTCDEGLSTIEELLIVGAISLMTDDTWDAREEVRLSMGLPAVELPTAELSAAEEAADDCEEAWLEAADEGERGARDTLSTVEGAAVVALEGVASVVAVSTVDVVAGPPATDVVDNVS